MHAAILREMGEVEILYNNAADEGTIMGLHGRIEDVNLEEMEKCWRVNTGAAFLVRPTRVAISFALPSPSHSLDCQPSYQFSHSSFPPFI